MKKKTMASLLVSGLLLQSLTACSSSSTSKTPEVQEETPWDFSLLLNLDPLTTHFYADLNLHPASSLLQEKTGVEVEYISPLQGQESTQFLFMMVDKTLPDAFRVDLEQEYKGGADTAVEDGMIIDATALIETHAPNFMARIRSHDRYLKSAFDDSGMITMFGAVFTEEAFRGQPLYGPMVNKTYLDKAGLEIPVTISDWEVMLQAFHDQGIQSPLSFGAESDFVALYDCFASAFGVTVSNIYYQEQGVVKLAPLEDGFYDFLVLMNKWYNNGWLDNSFASKDHSTYVTPNFMAGRVGATIDHINTPLLAQQQSEKLGTPMEFVAVPYPVLEEGDVVTSRHYLADFVSNPIYISSNAKNPEDIVSWIDYLYSEEGSIFTSWGEEGVTYSLDESEQRVFTDFVLENPEEAPVSVLVQNVLQDASMVYRADYNLELYEEETRNQAWEVWGLATTDSALPVGMTYSYEDLNVHGSYLDTLTIYVREMTVKFITGQEHLQNYAKFQDNVRTMGGEDFVEIAQSALNRYKKR